MENVVIASRTEANIYKNTKRGSLKLLNTMRNPIGRLKNKALQNDEAGVSRAKFKGSSPHSLASEYKPHDEAAVKFVRKIVTYLINKWNKNYELTFKIVAEPKFMGMIKSQFGKSKALNQVSWVDKDLQNIPPSKWPKLLGLKKIPMKKDL